MRNTSFTITVPHLFSPISAFSTESKSYIIALRFNFRETPQINQTNFLILLRKLYSIVTQEDLFDPPQAYIEAKVYVDTSNIRGGWPPDGLNNLQMCMKRPI